MEGHAEGGGTGSSKEAGRLERQLKRVLGRRIVDRRNEIEDAAFEATRRGERLLDDARRRGERALAAERERGEQALGVVRAENEQAIHRAGASVAASVTEQISARAAAEVQRAGAEAQTVAERRIADYAEQELSRKARRQELRLAREERESRIKAAEERIDRQAKGILEQTRSEVETLRGRDLAGLREEVGSLREQARREIEQLHGLIADAEATISQRAESGAEESRRRLAEEFRSQERAAGARLRAELGTIMLEARAELVALRQELARLGADIRNAAGRAEDRVAQTSRIAEATVSTRAQSAAAEAIRDLTSTAKDLSRRLEQQGRTLESREQLEDVLGRLRAADRRLRDSDARTRRALRHLQAVPDTGRDEQASG